MIFINTIRSRSSRDILLRIGSYGEVNRDYINTLDEIGNAIARDDLEYAEILRSRAATLSDELASIRELVENFAPDDLRAYANADFTLERDFLRARFIDGLTMEDIVETMHVSRSTVFRIAKHLGIHTSRLGLKYKKSGPHRYKIVHIRVSNGKGNGNA